MAGTPTAFQPDAFQNDAFQTGAGVATEDSFRLLPMLGVGFEWIFIVLWLIVSRTNS